MDSILFLCTGNYYRSRFAEEMFNHRAQKSEWRAYSRGLSQDMSSKPNIGPISSVVLDRLNGLGIEPIDSRRYPIPVKESGFEEAAVLIAMSREEHYPMMKSQYAEYAEGIEYWDVEDTGILTPGLAMNRIESLTDHCSNISN